jgi:putative ABC transport system permease protein
MLQNYLKIAFRSIWGNKLHTVINIVGLSLGIATCLLIVLFVKDEWTYDAFHSKADRIYRVWAKENWGENQEFFNTVTPYPMGPALKENFAEVEQEVRIVETNPQLKVGENQFTERVTIVGQHFFDVFDFSIVQGESKNLLSQINHVVLTERMAKKYFGNADPVNKTISIALTESFEEFVVKAVTENPPINSSIQYDVLVSDLNFSRMFSQQLLTSGWFNINPETYVLLRSNVSSSDLERKFPPVFKMLLGEEDYKNSKYTVGLQALTAIHLDTSFPAGIAPVSNPRYSYILAAIALLILVVACINFITLSVGRSLKRAKEVGIRKVAGADRKHLIFQFIGEALLITVLSLIAGLVLALVNLPLFNELSGKQLFFPVNMFMAGVILTLIVVIGIFSGSYPALVLSSFRPAVILKGGLQAGSSKQTIRKILVGLQLVFSVFLISSTLIMREQLAYLQNKDLGFNKEQLAVIQLNVPRTPEYNRLPDRVKAGFEKVEQFKGELARVTDIKGVCGTSHDFGNGSWTTVGYTDDKGVYRNFTLNTVEPDYFNVLAIEFAAGRNFDTNNPSDARRGVIVNEAFAKVYGWDDAIGKKIPGKNFLDHEVIGVVKDFNYESLYTKVQPLVMVMDPQIILAGVENINISNSPIPKLMVRLQTGNMSAAIDQITGIWEKLTGGEEFAFQFVDQSMAAQYRNEQNLGKIVSIATLLAVVIGSLGLYALASLAMQSRTKEISIRKVLGATEKSLLVLLSKEYIVLVGISLIVSIPLTWYGMTEWLQTFEYRVSVGIGFFVVAGLLSLVIALLTISYQTLKTASAQPAQTLKYE